MKYLVVLVLGSIGCFFLFKQEERLPVVAEEVAQKPRRKILRDKHFHKAVGKILLSKNSLSGPTDDNVESEWNEDDEEMNLDQKSVLIDLPDNRTRMNFKKFEDDAVLTEINEEIMTLENEIQEDQKKLVELKQEQNFENYVLIEKMLLEKQERLDFLINEVN